MLLKRRHVGGEIAPRQDAAMHLGVQGLDPSIEHFRKAGVIRHLGHVDAVVGQQLGGAAGGENIDSHTSQGAGEVEHAGFVGYRDKSLFNHDVRKVQSSDQSQRCVNQSVLLQFLAQRIAIYPEHVGRLRLIAVGARHHRFEYRFFNGEYHHFVDV